MEQVLAIEQKNNVDDSVKKLEVSQGSYLILAYRLQRTLDYLYEVLDFIEDHTWRDQLQTILLKLKKELATFSQLLNQKDNPVLVQQVPTKWPLLYQYFSNQFSQLHNDTALATSFVKLDNSQQSWIHLIETEIKQVFHSSPILTLDELRAEAKARLLESNLKTFVDAHQSLLSKIKKPTCFISYARGNSFHQQTVYELAIRLKFAGVEVFLDVWANKTGSMRRYLEKINKANSDYVIVVGTPLLRQQANNVTQEGWLQQELDQIAQRMSANSTDHGVIKLLLEGPANTAFPDTLNPLAYDFTDFELGQHYHEKFINLLELLYAKYPVLQEPIKQLRATLLADIEAMQHLTEQQLKQSLQLEQVTDYEKIVVQSQRIIEKLSQSLQMLFAELNPLSLWHVPVLGANFIGRQSLLTILHNKLTRSFPSAESIIAVCSGLGGVGKTLLALKYVYDHQHDYKYILWFAAESEEQLLSEYQALAEKLQLPTQNLKLSQIAEEIKAWLERNPSGLLVYDNAPNAALIEAYRPRIGSKLLITSRNNVWDQNQSMQVEVFGREESRDYIVTLTGFSLQEYQSAIDQLAETLGDLPLALAQACGYIAANQISLQEYLELYTNNCKEMLEDSTLPTEMHHDPVAVTWNITFKAIKEQQASAWPLLVSCAYLRANNIPEALLKALFDAHNSHATLKKFKELLGCLQRYSLLKRTDPIEKTYNMHRLVQDVIRREYEAAKQAASANELPEELNILMKCLFEPLIEIREENYRIVREYAPWIEHCNSFLKYVIADYKDTANLALASCLNKMGILLPAFGDQNHVKQAITYHRQALHIRKQQLNPNYLDIATSYNNLAEALQDLGGQINLKEAIECHRKALNIYNQQLSPDPLDIAISYNNLASTLIDLGSKANLEAAIKYHRKALKIREQQLGPDHLDVATSYNNLATALQALGGRTNLTEAIEYYQKALGISEQQLGPDHPKVALSYNNLAVVLKDLGGQANLTEAIEYYHKALGISEQQFGPDHPEVATSYNNLALALKALGGQANFKKAIEYHHKALGIFEQQLGLDHPDVATSYDNLALDLQKLGGQVNLKEAIEFHRKALNIYEKQFGPDHSDVATAYNNLAGALQDLGGQVNLKEAIEYYHRALKICEQQFGLDHSEVGVILLNLAVAYLGVSNVQKAYEHFQRAYSIFLAHPDYGPQHPDTQMAKAQLDKLASLSTSNSAPSSTHFFAQQKPPPASEDKEMLQALLARYELAKVAIPLAYEIALRRVAGFGSEEELKLLLKVVKDVNAQDNDPTKRKTAMHWAVEKGQVAHVKLLIAAGARADIKDASNKTALDYASTAELRELLVSTKPESASEAELKRETQVTTAESKLNCLIM